MKEKSNQVSSGSQSGYHTSVLLHESIDALEIKTGGIYVDATFGGGGHSREILNRLGTGGRLIVFDQDADALGNVPDDDRVVFVQANFRELHRFLRLHNAVPVDGILADLGVSSWQFDTAERGFSYRFDGPLDMRMNRNADRTAAEVLNDYTTGELQQMFSEYGELRNAKTFAEAIVARREVKSFVQISDLLELCETHRIGDKHKYMAQVFQAIRIEVNDELGALKDFLQQSAEVLVEGGTLAVITFHSLEDRLVKNFMRNGNFSDEPDKDMYGNSAALLKPVTRKPILPEVAEQKTNSRSRSAKLRVARKV